MLSEKKLAAVDSAREDIRSARTVPSSFYNAAFFEKAKDSIFARSWLFIADDDFAKDQSLTPFTLMEGFLDEPLLLAKNESGELNCLSNVCTHRGALLVENSCSKKNIRCPYHGRTFDPCGRMLAAPGFDNAKNFPGETDHLPQLPLERWRQFLFTSISPSIPFSALIEDMEKRISWLPVEEFKFDAALSKDYLVKANWALYIDNYLEGLHVPYVHPTLARLLDVKSYRTEVHSYSNLQVGVASGDESTFDLPESSPDYGQNIAAYYYWLYPNLMMNFYPWGLSVNVIHPLTPDTTLVRFLTYVWKMDKMEGYSVEDIDQTQKEDEYVVELVKRGLKSRLYSTGRYAPDWEAGVHHFHQLLSRSFAEG